MIRGEVYGNIYLTEKAGGAEFDAADEELLAVLAEYAAIGIHHARRFNRQETHRDELQRTNAALSATSEIARDLAGDLAGEVDLDPILELVAKRGRALVAARALVILLPDHAGLRVAHAAGEVPGDLVGRTVGESSVASAVMRSRQARPSTCTSSQAATRPRHTTTTPSSSAARSTRATTSVSSYSGRSAITRRSA